MDKKTDANRSKSKRNFHRLTRREFVRLALVASGGLGLTLAGCSPQDERGRRDEGQPAVVDAWVAALNNEDMDSFTKLLSESVVATTHFEEDHVLGREQVWELYQASTGNQIEKIVHFGQDPSICLLTNATKFNRSLCYVFNIENGLINKIYEYTSGSYYLASSPLFSGLEVTMDEAGLGDRLVAMDAMFVDGLNNRDFSLPAVKDEAIMFVPTSTDPIIGKESISLDGESYALFYPSVNHKKIQTFGQGNLVCTHVMVSGAPKGSLCFVSVFDGGSIAELYEFWSDARLEGQA